MEHREALITFFETMIPFNVHLGMKVTELEEGSCQLTIPFQAHLIGDPFRPALHGGVLSTVMDAAGGLAVFTTMPSYQSRVSTVDLRVDYLRPGLSEDIVCDARIIRIGNKVAVTTMAVVQRDGTHVVCEGRGVYNVIRAEEP